MRLFQLIRNLANEGVRVSFEEDFGGNTLTVSFKSHKAAFPVNDEKGETKLYNSSHTHTGYPECDEAEGLHFLIVQLEEILKQAKEAK